jgi:hypothetical protein
MSEKRNHTRAIATQQIELALDPGDLHLFDPVSGTRLTHEPLRAAHEDP